jgi:hypothetical protein
VQSCFDEFELQKEAASCQTGLYFLMEKKLVYTQFPRVLDKR